MSSDIDRWMIYVKHSYGIILDAEAKLCINLEHNIEAYMVHLFARYLDKPVINSDPVCLRIMQGINLPIHQKRSILISVAEECLLINGLELAKNKWPCKDYYIDMGRIAYERIAYIENPVDEFYVDLGEKFNILSAVLGECKVKHTVDFR